MIIKYGVSVVEVLRKNKEMSSTYERGPEIWEWVVEEGTFYKEQRRILINE